MISFCRYRKKLQSRFRILIRCIFSCVRYIQKGRLNILRPYFQFMWRLQKVSVILIRMLKNLRDSLWNSSRQKVTKLSYLSLIPVKKVVICSKSLEIQQENVISLTGVSMNSNKLKAREECNRGVNKPHKFKRKKVI